MIKLDKIGIFVFAALAIAALTGVIFYKAYHHIGTVVLCSVLILVFIVDIKKEKKQK
jgi:hypothetical protein